MAARLWCASPRACTPLPGRMLPSWSRRPQQAPKRLVWPLGCPEGFPKWFWTRLGDRKPSRLPRESCLSLTFRCDLRRELSWPLEAPPRPLAGCLLPGDSERPWVVPFCASLSRSEDREAVRWPSTRRCGAVSVTEVTELRPAAPPEGGAAMKSPPKRDHQTGSEFS
jgi:hypothetical protein